MAKPEREFKTYTEFWPHYLREHSDPTCRKIHYIGTMLAFIPIIAAIFFKNALFLLGWPLIGYGFAWYAHFKIEKNKPATFTYPFWSLISDYRMLYCWMTGTLQPHLLKAGLADNETAPITTATE
ncbi:MAG: Mpo1-like protein [bacterium]